MKSEVCIADSVKKSDNNNNGSEKEKFSFNDGVFFEVVKNKGKK